jgi:uncharacterized protein
MPLFAVIAHDLPGAHERRMAARPAHFAYVETIADKIALAGPLRTPDGQGFVGSVLIYDTETADQARALLEADPYYQAGIWRAPELHPFTAAIGTLIGGKIW